MEDLEIDTGAVLEAYWGTRNATGRLHDAHWVLTLDDARVEGLIKLSDMTINLAAICTPAGDYDTRPLDAIYGNFIDELHVVKYCSENNERLIHFSTCEVYGK
ncbi:UDP-D-apiose/UDP-D-xylose synthase 2 [Stylosanthes scabra]|uniref:UDP-D-apiose/UDP-D-xylose synthase 2 n=1 Tax=Stylosanthes scabra TaxID=79078 RepID=A0ABU6V7Z7_9FABA|nr:UDP-D-apiose/UDP-D-xylose synthase 2 [Stylosanthes scabra]